MHSQLYHRERKQRKSAVAAETVRNNWPKVVSLFLQDYLYFCVQWLNVKNNLDTSNQHKDTFLTLNCPIRIMKTKTQFWRWRVWEIDWFPDKFVNWNCIVVSHSAFLSRVPCWYWEPDLQNNQISSLLPRVWLGPVIKRYSGKHKHSSDHVSCDKNIIEIQ